MKFGKRRQEVQVPGVPGVTIPKASPKGAKRRPDPGDSKAPAPAAPAVTDSWTAPPAAPAAAGGPGDSVADPEPVVEGEAVELPPVEPAAPVYEPAVPLTLQGSASTPDPIAFPAAEQPVTVVEAGSRAGPAPVTSLGDSGEAFASGHAAAPGPSWQEPVMELANERPELVVGAAFAGGVLAAMILRRLGS